MTERYRRTDFGHMDIAVTFQDPGVFAKPFWRNIRASTRGCTSGPPAPSRWVSLAIHSRSPSMVDRSGLSSRKPRRTLPAPDYPTGFIPDEHGIATDVVEVHVSGDYKYARQK